MVSEMRLSSLDCGHVVAGLGMGERRGDGHRCEFKQLALREMTLASR